MNIVTLVLSNWVHRPATNRFPDRPVPSAGFRGAVVVDPDICVTCGTCEYVCVSAAIEVTQQEVSGTWTYDPGRCTFCGACVRHCPVQALHQESDCAANYLQPGQTVQSETIAYPPCSECGRPTLPHPANLDNSAWLQGGEAIHQRSSLCSDCRGRAIAAAMRDSSVNV